jgi:cyclophilin family peptidyl-prolyl cis-trans isomerase
MSLKRRAVTWLALAVALAACGGKSESEGETQQTEEDTMASQPVPVPPDTGGPTRVVLETSKGRIVIELDREKAPKTTENVLYHVVNHFYDGLIFQRVRAGFMIQTGGYTAELGHRQSTRPAIENEAANGLKNVRGSVAMARHSDPHSATTQFFINLVDNPRLDFSAQTPEGWGYAVFGHVVEGLDVVDAIAAVPTRAIGVHEAVPVERIVIQRAYVQQ